MQRIKLGGQGLEVSAQGLGCMGMTWAYGGGDEQSGLDTIGRALDLGVTFLDTAEVYGPYINERLVGRAVAGRRDQFEIATKFGFTFDPDDPYASRRLDGSPENVEARLRGIARAPRHRLHRPLLPAPCRSGGADRGDGRRAGGAGRGRQGALHRPLGGVRDVIRRAHATHPLTAVQSEYSLWTRDPESEVLPTLRELGIGLVAYSPLGRGFLTGQIRSVDDLSDDDWRRSNPRFQEDALRQNIELADRVRALAEEHGVTPPSSRWRGCRRRGTTPSRSPVPSVRSGSRRTWPRSRSS